MKQFLELGGGLVLTGVVLGIGVLARGVLFWYYGLLGHACKRLDVTKNRTIRYIKKGLRERKNSGVVVQSTAVYTEYCLAERKVAGIRVGTWESSSIQAILLAMMTGAVGALGGVLWECDGKRILEMLFAAGGSAVILMAMDLLFDSREKRKRIGLCIRDYAENVWESGELLTGGETKVEHAVVEYRKKERRPKRKATAKEAKRTVKESKRREKAAGKRRCKAQEEKRRLTEELLRERRMLEARQLAEYKKCEASAEAAAVQETVAQTAEPVAVQTAEAAAVVPVNGQEPQIHREQETVKRDEVSYEEMLKNVLAEYFA